MTRDDRLQQKPECFCLPKRSNLHAASKRNHNGLITALYIDVPELMSDLGRFQGRLNVKAVVSSLIRQTKKGCPFIEGGHK